MGKCNINLLINLCEKKNYQIGRKIISKIIGKRKKIKITKKRDF